MLIGQDLLPHAPILEYVTESQRKERGAKITALLNKFWVNSKVQCSVNLSLQMISHFPDIVFKQSYSNIPLDSHRVYLTTFETNVTNTAC